MRIVFERRFAGVTDVFRLRNPQTRYFMMNMYI